MARMYVRRSGRGGELERGRPVVDGRWFGFPGHNGRHVGEKGRELPPHGAGLFLPPLQFFFFALSMLRSSLILPDHRLHEPVLLHF